MKLIPLGNRLIVERDAPDTLTKQGIIISAPKDKNTWTVRECPLELNSKFPPGTRVYIPSFAGLNINVPEGVPPNWKFVSVDEVVAIIED